MVGDDAETILVVDDDPGMRAFYAAVLRKGNFRSMIAENGSVALDILSSEHVDCLIIDSRMPIMTGPETVEQLRSSPRHALLPIIMVTGSDELVDRIRGLDLGANDYLVKPVDPTELLARIRAQLRVRSSWLDATRSFFQRKVDFVDSLSRIDSDWGLKEQALVIVNSLEALDEVHRAAIYAFSKNDAAVFLAGSADHPINSSGELSRSLSVQLREIAARGPVLLRAGVEERWWSQSNSESVFTVPLGPREEALGVLVVASGGGAVGESQGLALTIDIASAVNFVLGAKLRSLAGQAFSVGEIRAALKLPGTHMAFQPVVDLVQSRVAGYEALARFGDNVRPDHRLSDARSAGILDEMELALFQMAVSPSSELPPDCWLSVNLSSTVLVAHPEISDITGAAPRTVVIEVTEHERITDYQQVRESISSLAGSPLLSVDDAGAGYASLRHIFELSPSFIKLDREWVVNIDSDPVRQSLVDALVSFSHRSGAKLVAEGIETVEELMVLREAGVDLGQGYLLGMPTAAPGEAPEKILERLEAISST